MDVPETPDALAPEPGVVVMMCGVAGAGKTTCALRLAARGFRRLSIDEIICRRIGHDAALLDPAEYERHQATAEQELQETLIRLIVTRRPVVLDLSLWNRATRDHYKALIERHGGTWILVYLKADPDTVRRRLAVRNAQAGPNSVTVSPELLERYLDSFEEPRGEGELIVVQS